MAQITYTNKVALNENPDIADINKVTDDDMNEIKSVVNANYNNTIQITDTEPTDSDNKIWIDTGEVGSAVSEITNEYSTSTGLGYSANYINELVSQRETEVILDLNWENQDKQITVEDGYLYIAFISWASSCVLFQYANGTNINRQIAGSNSFTSNKVDNTYTIHIDNTGLMFGFKIKI